MRFKENSPPRAFQVGRAENSLTLYDCGRVELEPDEQITLATPDGKESDVARKEWGYYITPSLNRRLPRFNLRAALVKSYDGTFFVWLVETDREEAMRSYALEHDIKFMTWLDEGSLPRIEALFGDDGGGSPCLCGSSRFEKVFHYREAPEGEVGFSFSNTQEYDREVLSCVHCGHFVSRHDMIPEGFYEGGYVDGTYGDDAGLQRTYGKIMALSQDKSDNAGRVNRILRFAAERRGWDANSGPSILDVGSGLCVFLGKMKEYGWRGTALDPDPRAAAHARDFVGVSAVQTDFTKAEDLGRFDVITFNKVLEHIPDPTTVLAQAKDYLEPGGFVYVELPDGEIAVHDGPGREEFFIEHWHIFSMSSFVLMAANAGFIVEEIERLQEPSTKYTLRAFLALPRGELHGR